VQFILPVAFRTIVTLMLDCTLARHWFIFTRLGILLMVPSSFFFVLISSYAEIMRSREIMVKLN
jgi:hypothetical protein